LNNPDAQPGSVAQAPRNSPRISGAPFWVIGLVATLFCLVPGMVWIFVVPAFAQVYSSFGAVVPLPSMIVVRTAPWWWLIAAAAIGLWLFGSRSPSRMEHRPRLALALLWLAVASGGLLGFALWSLYLPIFNLGAAQ